MQREKTMIRRIPMLRLPYLFYGQASPVRLWLVEKPIWMFCRATVVLWREGAENEIVALEADFPHMRYFSCSSLGRAPDQSGQPFVADRVLTPLFWLLDGRKQEA